MLSATPSQGTHVGAGRAPATDHAVAFRPVPYPYKAALAICSDLDETPDRRIYLECARFLNTTDETIMGRGVGLEIGNTIYFDMPSDQFAYWTTDDAGRDMARALIRSGHIDCLHSFGDFATSRRHVERALADLADHGCHLEVWVDHATAATNLGSDIMRGSGDVPGSSVYHADLTYQAGMRFVWRGRVTSMIGQNVPPSLAGVWRPSHPAQASRTVLKEATKLALASVGHEKYRMHVENRLLCPSSLRDGKPVYEFLRFNPHFGGVSCGDRASGVPEALSLPMLQRLSARRALGILYTHLGKIRSYDEPFESPTREAFRQLADMQARKEILVATTRRLLGFAAALDQLSGRMTSDGTGTRVDLTLSGTPIALTARDLSGVTVYVTDPAHTRLFVGNTEVTGVVRNPPDETGRPSLMIPWPKLAFPL